MFVEQVGSNIIINTHPNQFLGIRKPITKSKSSQRDGYMSKDDYIDTLNRKKDFLYRCKFEHTKCKFMTLNTQQEISIEDLNYTLKKFLGKLEYEYGKFEYVRALECYNKGTNRYHYHIILVYNKSCPNIELKWLKKN